MENTKTFGAKLREVQNFYATNTEEAFENWVEALLLSKETEMTIASLRGSSSYIFMRSSVPGNEKDTLPPFPSPPLLSSSSLYSSSLPFKMNDL